MSVLRIVALSGNLRAASVNTALLREIAAEAPPGDLIAPTDYRDWIFLSSGLDMNYRDATAAREHAFDNVFVDPASWRAFRATGHWPEGTVFAKEGRHGETSGSINHSGQFQAGERTYLELHVRDRRFPTGWGFFEVAGDGPARVLPTTASCYSCHQQHAAVETTFVQFYPTGRSRSARERSMDRGSGPPGCAGSDTARLPALTGRTREGPAAKPFRRGRPRPSTYPLKGRRLTLSRSRDRTVGADDWRQPMAPAKTAFASSFRSEAGR